MHSQDACIFWTLATRLNTGVKRTGPSTMLAVPTIKYVLGYQSRTRNPNNNKKRKRQRNEIEQSYI